MVRKPVELTEEEIERRRERKREIDRKARAKYYYNHKQRVLDYNKAYYERNREEIIKKQSERARKKREQLNAN